MPSPHAEIALADSVHPSVRFVVRKRVQPILRDVRTMLAHPVNFGDPGFNLSAALVLASVIAGLSRVFFSTVPASGRAFRATAERYPLAHEPHESGVVTSPKKFAKVLYETYRNTLAHSLGLTVKHKGGVCRIVELEHTPKVIRDGALSEVQLTALDRLDERPSGLRPTLRIRADSVVMLSPDALYWGVRRLTRDLAHDDSLRAASIAFLAPWWAGRTADSMSTTPVEARSTAGPAYYAPLEREPDGE